jgi:hypothetical protein
MGPEYDYAINGWKIDGISDYGISWTCDVEKFSGRATDIEFKTEGEPKRAVYSKSFLGKVWKNIQKSASFWRTRNQPS